MAKATAMRELYLYKTSTPALPGAGVSFFQLQLAIVNTFCIPDNKTG
jgi:hypothetical protein